MVRPERAFSELHCTPCEQFAFGISAPSVLEPAKVVIERCYLLVINLGFPFDHRERALVKLLGFVEFRIACSPRT